MHPFTHPLLKSETREIYKKIDGEFYQLYEVKIKGDKDCFFFEIPSKALKNKMEQKQPQQSGFCSGGV